MLKILARVKTALNAREQCQTRELAAVRERCRRQITASVEGHKVAFATHIDVLLADGDPKRALAFAPIQASANAKFDRILANYNRKCPPIAV